MHNRLMGDWCMLFHLCMICLSRSGCLFFWRGDSVVSCVYALVVMALYLDGGNGKGRSGAGAEEKERKGGGAEGERLRSGAEGKRGERRAGANGPESRASDREVVDEYYHKV